ncbi:type II toxin-antitoxin system VapC family toxin [Nonomuraea sp. KC401]|uniref:type II toxin-antitoxin system VapC family toxin n=1 Tax=unclassified Nonomuraea TaxID=2593643 RepID=UPI0010FDA6E8|nr:MULTISPECIES: type II toxin-antitoxin system VapC family toxin [unclassified Nonomuraea]NBE98554.1 PIN domain-containing protein [Nonomuraea sp. K271]TLF74218.1 type II toxin-antitoxin system VapC family toxin [Nonomuraea sp. KC401]
MTHSLGLLDTNILVLRAGIDPDELPDEMMISAITTAELSAGVLAAAGTRELAQRMKILQTAEAEFDPLPFDDTAAREYGQLWTAVSASGREPRPRAADLMIASVAIANGLPLYTCNPKDFQGLDQLLAVVPVTRPH